MAGVMFRATAVSAVVLAALYQYLAKSLIFDTLGYGRVVRDITTFDNVDCQKVDDLGLEGCEDMWLNDRTGLLYMACSNSQSRVDWLPAMDHLNASGRSLTDRLVVLDARGTGPVASRIRTLKPENFAGTNGDGILNLHGFDIREDSKQTLHILLINHRPPLDPVTGQPLDAAAVGANSTIEHFEATSEASSMKHVKTYHHDSIQTPNRVAWVSDEEFVFSNDHSSKVGLRRQLDVLIGGGSIGYCNKSSCKIAKGTGLTYPNGLARGDDGLIYTPSALTGEVRVLSLNEERNLIDVGSVKVPIPVDNLSVDKHGHILATGFPQIYKLLKTGKDPHGQNSPSGVYVLQRQERQGLAALAKSEWHNEDVLVTKVMEDNGSVLSGFSIAVHDVETGRLFLGGPLTPFITICETK